MCTKTQDKGAVTPQETDPDMPMSVQASPTDAWVSGDPLQGLLKEVAIVFITSFITIVGLRLNNREVTQHHPSTEKVKIY